MKLFPQYISLFALLLPTTTAEQVKFTATTLSAKLPTALGNPSAIYDGIDSIFIFGGNKGLQYYNDILHYNISTSKVISVGAMPNSGAGGVLSRDEFGNIFYFGGGIEKTEVYKFNPSSRRCDNVTTLPFKPVHCSSVPYNQSSILIFGGWKSFCKTVISFDLNTLESVIVKNTTENNCGSLVVHEGDTAFLYRWNTTVRLIDLKTFDEKNFSVDSFNFDYQSSFVKKGRNVYILGSYKDNKIDGSKHGIINFDLDTISLSFAPVDKFVLGGRTYFDIAPTAVFVAKLNRIYFFGGHSITENISRVYHNDIWYIDLIPVEEKIDSSTNLWWIALGITITILLIFLLIFAFLFHKKSQKAINIPDVIQNKNIRKKENSPVWKSPQPLELLSIFPAGKGSFAEVFKARNRLQPNLNFAIKKIRLYKALQHMQWDICKVLREVENLSEIHSPNVVRMWNYWIEDDSGNFVSEDAMKQLPVMEWTSTQDSFLFLQTEFCDFTLREWLTENKTLERRMAKDVNGMMSQIVNGLRGIHEKGIIHRDIKPTNIFYSENGNLWKIGDLGLSAKATEASEDEQTVAGCRLYRSPEMDSKEKTASYSFKSDVFSLGLTFLEIIYILPSGKSYAKMFQDVRTGEKDFTEFPKNIIEDFIELVSKMLISDPSDRIDIFHSSIDTLLSKK